MRFTSYAKHNSSLIEHVRTLFLPGVHLGAITVLTPTNHAAGDESTALAAAGLKSIKLLAHDGTPIAAIRAGTIERAKGLELKQVRVVRTPPRLLEPGPISGDTAERCEPDRLELSTAMTCSRDGLLVWVA